MKYFFTIFIVLASVAVTLACTEKSGSRQLLAKIDSNAEVLPITNDFYALTVLTPDSDFRRKVFLPGANPEFKRVEKLKIGERAELHVIFTNPQIDKKDSADVTLDVKVTKPDNSVTHFNGQEGIIGRLSGPSSGYYLAKASVQFTAKSTDSIGEWKIDVTIHDNNRHISIPLSEKFVLEK